MKTLILVSIVALAASGAALAEPVTRTTTYDGPKVDATRVTVRDKAAGTYSRDMTAIRASDGAIATRSYDRTRADTGVTASGSATGFNGKTRSFDYERTRTDTGYTASGTATGRGGETYTLAGQGMRTDSGYTRDRTVTNSAGATVFDKNVTATRANGQITRDVSTTRAAGFHRPRFGGGRRH
ncbi:nucleoside 2-deoxyribosyltransferase [Sphingomonas sp. SUN039]|uniref:nucleoside 2-deoxyribosyltransferase n=1 Tax=Sphingomonas sp. SUN039 TaxID=2937787 RepID=UPI00216425CB|nr:nucleoside 2-deoxyribosyltransferase [Sphingomonas sp. SUN039]UVO54099.1 nucleoside 2-deoxyribosyltransferase [Sphingomonas sp. SUN039]